LGNQGEFFSKGKKLCFTGRCILPSGNWCLKRSGINLTPKGNWPKNTIANPKKRLFQLEINGLRAEEALEKVDRFISDSLLNGFDEIIIYHGVGTGKLSYAVKEFLKSHPSVKSFEVAPMELGGFGATVVKL